MSVEKMHIEQVRRYAHVVWLARQQGKSRIRILTMLDIDDSELAYLDRFNEQIDHPVIS